MIDIIARGRQQANITELDRLRYIVHKIDHECAVVPGEAFKNTPNGELVQNLNYKGVKHTDLGLSSFKHFRNIDEKIKIKKAGKWCIF